jgi:fructose-1,6-bisphosphatase I / sedoheptulose-1,7-bisphosphatase
LSKRSTLTQFLIEERRRFPGASGDFNALILDVALACKAIARAVAFGELGGMLGNPRRRRARASTCRARRRRSWT